MLHLTRVVVPVLVGYLPWFRAGVGIWFQAMFLISKSKNSISAFGVCEGVYFLNSLCAVRRRVCVMYQPLGVYLIHAVRGTYVAPLLDQQSNVQALLELKRLAINFTGPAKCGVPARLLNGSLNLAFALVRAGRRREVIGSALSSLIETPGWLAVHNLAGILKG